MKLDHIAIRVGNIDAAIKWYKSNLGAEIKYSDESWAMMDIGGSKLALVLGEIHPPHIAFSLSENAKFGDKSEVKSHRDGSHYVYLDDPFGNTIEIIKYFNRED